MVSIRDTASRCLGISGSFSVVGDLFGYIYGAPSRPLSVMQQVSNMRGTSFNLSIIFVGHRDDFSGTFTWDDALEVTFAVQRMRELYAQVGVGVRRLYWTHIPEDDVGGYAAIANSGEACDLTQDWSANNDGIDVFFVQSIGDADGWSAVGGTCSKNNTKGWSGTVLELDAGSPEITGIILAHEVGHYLGLGSGPSINNVMGSDADGDGVDTISGASTMLTAAQGNTMKTHCSMRPPV